MAHVTRLINTYIINFQLTPESRRHLERHFGDGALAGSYFLQSTFETPDDLLLFLQNTSPVSVIKQPPSAIVFTYTLTNGRMAGTVGIMKKCSLSEKDLVREVREGFTIEVGLIEELRLTPDFCVVVRETLKGLSIITAFPGNYARPFAQKGQPAKEYALNKQFWAEHVLLRKKS